MKVLFVALLVLFVLRAVGQTVSIQGSVVNAEDRTPVSYANVTTSKNHGIGAVTNSSGDFLFVLPSEFSNDTLVISHVGYKTYRVALRQVSADLIIALKPAVVELREVVVRSDGAKKLVQDALESIRLLYPTTPYVLEGFQRTWEKIDFTDSITYPGTLIEAAFAAFDPGYGTDLKAKGKPSEEEIYLLEVRRSAIMPGWNYNGNML